MYYTLSATLLNGSVVVVANRITTTDIFGTLENVFDRLLKNGYKPREITYKRVS